MVYEPKKRSFWGLIRMKNGRFLVGQKLSEISEKLGEGGSQLERFFGFFLMASPIQDTDLFS